LAQASLRAGRPAVAVFERGHRPSITNPLGSIDEVRPWHWLPGIQTCRSGRRKGPALIRPTRRGERFERRLPPRPGPHGRSPSGPRRYRANRVADLPSATKVGDRGPRPSCRPASAAIKPEVTIGGAEDRPTTVSRDIGPPPQARTKSDVWGNSQCSPGRSRAPFHGAV